MIHNMKKGKRKTKVKKKTVHGMFSKLINMTK